MGMKISLMARLPLRSRLTSRLLLSYVSQCHFMLRKQFEIGQTTVPAIENHQFRLKSALFGLLDHLLKVVILAQTILGLVVQSKITRQPALAICPDQRDQVDALHQSMMFAKTSAG
jgi:hypothetical protein